MGRSPPWTVPLQFGYERLGREPRPSARGARADARLQARQARGGTGRCHGIQALVQREPLRPAAVGARRDRRRRGHRQPVPGHGRDRPDRSGSRAHSTCPPSASRRAPARSRSWPRSSTRRATRATRSSSHGARSRRTRSSRSSPEPSRSWSASTSRPATGSTRCSRPSPAARASSSSAPPTTRPARACTRPSSRPSSTRCRATSSSWSTRPTSSSSATPRRSAGSRSGATAPTSSCCAPSPRRTASPASGWGMPSPTLPVAAALRKTATPFGVNSVAQAAAIASLDAFDELAERVESLVAERDRVVRALADQGWKLPQSDANFVWFPLGSRLDRVLAGVRRGRSDGAPVRRRRRARHDRRGRGQLAARRGRRSASARADRGDNGGEPRTGRGGFAWSEVGMGTVRDGLASRWLSGRRGAARCPAGRALAVPRRRGRCRPRTASTARILSRQWEWSWGRVRETGLEGVELRDVWNPVALVILVALLVASLAGVAVWASRRPAWGQVAGLVTIGLLTGRVLTTVAARVGRSLGEVDQGGSGLMVRTRDDDGGLAGVSRCSGAARGPRAHGRRGDGREAYGVRGRRGREADTEPGPRADARRGGVGDAPALRPAGEHLSGPIIELAEEQGG